MSADDDKRLAAIAAAAEIDAGMIVGLGTGSTAAHLIAHLGERVRAGLKITAVATSLATEAAARAAGIAVLPLDDIAEIDIAIDGVDEIDGQARAIKGAGGAMLREKIVATAARRMIAIADGSKRVAMLGHAPVPVEVLPLARAFVADRIARLGATPVLRLRDGRPWRTDQDNLILDSKFPGAFDPLATAAQLAAIPGLLGHGLFLDEIDSAYIAHDGAVSRVDRAR
ncbi:ribose 5-phosphate isomerase [Sphingomonas sp. Leaf357]|uniref:ribose-5-phosphate isomerase RpiA n=1 Tax=Sphingomonas sp. Leaf357 TaxID=1736350 RepID=UPI0006F7483A|nr:ribose-5-phosphate isomerase RpiA [Sphingomonas sp. Leaf357]KQS02125.1 ribose 5-phosphate isomerase [Sphingomonas sp. Leaf357]